MFELFDPGAIAPFLGGSIDVAGELTLDLVFVVCTQLDFEFYL